LYITISFTNFIVRSVIVKYDECDRGGEDK